MRKRKKELPTWFRVETIIFLFFSVAIGGSYLKSIENLNTIEAHSLLLKMTILIGVLTLIWLISLIFYYCKK